ncbi:MAG: DUF262 domain-containing protein [Erysipelotrichaceae bacterium]
MQNSNDKITLNELNKMITNKEVFVPDFQRKFVWPLDKQIDLLASIFAKLPVGTLLSIDGNFSSYRSKSIGSKKQIKSIEFDDENVEFLLDGQQRCSVILNAFSDTIFSNNNFADVYDKLKYRFFLKFPKSNFNSSNEIDIFKLSTLNFKKHEEMYLSPANLRNQIIGIPLKAHNKVAYNPYWCDKHKDDENYSLQNEMKIFALEKDPDFYLLPLFIFCEEDKYGDVSSYLEAIAQKQSDFLFSLIKEKFFKNEENYMEDKMKLNEKFGKEIFDEKTILNQMELRTILNKLKNNWVLNVTMYLENCKNLNLYKISDHGENREKAIDIYENLNRGGICLDAFDLLVARAGMNSTDGLTDIIDKCISDEFKLPKFIEKSRDDNYSPLDLAGFTDDENITNKTFRNCYMNLLCILNKYDTIRDDVEDLESHAFSRESILNLKGSEIINNTNKAVKGLCRAAYFFRTRLSIKNITDINYDHVFTIVSYFLSDDNLYNKKNCFDIIHAWYYYMILSGEFNSDQTQKFVKNIKYLTTLCYNNDCKKSFAKESLRSVFSERFMSAQDFSDDVTLLRDNKSVNVKPAVSDTMVNYYLQKSKMDFDGESTEINLDSELQLHHIFPLRASENIKDSEKKLRSDKNNILNSPLNLIWISKGANNSISNKSVIDYFRSIDNSVLVSYHIDKFKDVFDFDKIKELKVEEYDEKIKKALNDRLDKFKSNIKEYIDILLK